MIQQVQSHLEQRLVSCRWSWVVCEEEARLLCSHTSSWWPEHWPGRSLKALTFLSWGSKTQKLIRKGHGGLRHLGLHHGFCGPQTPSPAPAPEEERVQRPTSWRGLWEGTGSAGPSHAQMSRMEQPGPGKVAKGHASWLLSWGSGPSLAGWTGVSIR